MLVKDAAGRWYEIEEKSLSGKEVDSAKAREALAIEAAARRQRVAEVIAVLDEAEREILQQIVAGPVRPGGGVFGPGKPVGSDCYANDCYANDCYANDCYKNDCYTNDCYKNDCAGYQGNWGDPGIGQLGPQFGVQGGAGAVYGAAFRRGPARRQR